MIRQVFENLGGMNTYWRDKSTYPDDGNLYVEFKTESDLIDATGRTIYFKTHKIIGAKRGEQWTPSLNKNQSQHNIDPTIPPAPNVHATGSNKIIITNPKLTQQHSALHASLDTVNTSNIVNNLNTTSPLNVSKGSEGVLC